MALGSTLAVPGLARGCEAYPLGNFRTNNNYIFLREILQAGDKAVDSFEAGVCLQNWLIATASGSNQPEGQYAGAAGSGVLVIDQTVDLVEPIRIPSQMIISGVGIRGAGRLRFRDLEPGVAAITFEPAAPGSPSYVSLQDLRIYNVGPKGSTVGLDIADVGDIVYMRRLSMGNWDQAILNDRGYSVIMEQCDLHNNGVHVRLGLAANAMRIRECRFTGATGPAILMNFPPVPGVEGPVDANSCLVTGCTFSGNQYGIFVDAHLAATMVGNSFLGNTAGGIFVTSAARQARIIGNYFEGGDTFEFANYDADAMDPDYPVVGQGHHQWGFNTVVGLGDELATERLEGVYVERIYARAFNQL